MKKNLYNEVNEILGSFTPLKADCGQLCSKNCCKGDSRMGMLLFPEEETTLNVIEENGRRLAVCSGTCNRNERPLSCRIFPFFPVYQNGRIRAVHDLRGINICPLLAHSDEVKFSRRFLRRVEKAGELLYTDGDCAAFMDEVAKEIEEILEINSVFLNRK